MHLPGDGSASAGFGILETQNFDGPGADGLGDGHTGQAGFCVGDDLDLAPFVRVKPGMRNFRENVCSGVIVSGTIIPVTAVGHLELNPVQCIGSFFSGGPGRAKDQNASLMIGLAGDVANLEDQAKISIALSSVDDSPSSAGTGHRAIFHDPGVGFDHPTGERFAIEDRLHLVEQTRAGFRLRRHGTGYKERQNEGQGFHERRGALNRGGVKAEAKD